MTARPSFELIHAHYCNISGLQIQYSRAMDYWWEQWDYRGFTKADLDLVIAYLHRRIKAKRRGIESLAIRNLIARPDNFAEDLAIAKAELRSFRPPSQREKILTATGRTEESLTPPKSTRSIVGEKPIELLIKELREAVV